jgi:enoyl-CoA hydratase
MGKVRLEADGGRRLLTLDDPDRRNALDAAMQRDLAAAIAAVADDRDARALVVTGAGTAFCAGADLPAIFGRPDRPVAELRRELHAVYDSFLRLLALPIPTLAAVQGPAVGAGLNLAMACDLRVAGPGARFSATFTSIGLHPGGGCTWFLVRALGPQRAMALLLDGGTVHGPDAVAAGLALSVEDDPLAAALARADRYAGLEPDLVRDVKTAVQMATRGDFASTLEFESWAQASSSTSPRLREFVATFS